MMSREKIGLIACQKNLPVVLCQQLRKKGYDVVVIGFTEFPSLLTPHYRVSLGQIGRIFRFLKDNHIKNIVLAGAMSRPSLWRLRFDWQGIQLAMRLFSYFKKGDDALLGSVCDAIEKRGIKICSISELCPELLMPQGVMSKKSPDVASNHSIILGQKLLNNLSEFDIGQSVVVSGKIVLGIETLGGTDMMISHVCSIEKARLNNLPRPILIKTRKLRQSNLVDLPTIGIATIEAIVKAGFSGIALEANGCIVLDYDKVVSLINEHDLFLIGI